MGWDDICAVPETAGWTNGNVQRYYLFYYSFMRPSFRDFHLDDTTVFRVKVIDTWNGTVEDRGTVCGRFRVELPGRPYMAIQLKREESPWL